MSPTKRLKPVQRLAQNREDKAARTLGESRRLLQQDETKLEQLILYQQEYQERFNAVSRQGISASQLQEYRAFLDKLATAIRQQQDQVDKRRMEASGDMDKWRLKHTRTQALNKALDRFRQTEKKAQDKGEQKDTDERNQRAG